MRTPYFQNRSFLMYLLIGIGVASIFLTLFWLVVNTAETSRTTSQTVGQVQEAIDTLKADIEADHVRQTSNQAKILKCLTDLFVAETTATKAEVDTCTAPIPRDGDKGSAGPTGALPSSGPSSAAASTSLDQEGVSSFPNNTSNGSEKQPEISPTPTDSIIDQASDLIKGVL